MIALWVPSCEISWMVLVQIYTRHGYRRWLATAWAVAARILCLSEYQLSSFQVAGAKFFKTPQH